MAPLIPRYTEADFAEQGRGPHAVMLPKKIKPVDSLATIGIPSSADKANSIVNKVTGLASGMVNKVKDWDAKNRNQDIFGDYAKNNMQTERVTPRPFIDRSGGTPKSQVFGALADRTHNMFNGMENFHPGTERPVDTTQTPTGAAAHPKYIAPHVPYRAPATGSPVQKQRDAAQRQTEGGFSANPNEEGLREKPTAAPMVKSAGYAQYVDGSPIELPSEEDRALMPGTNPGKLSIVNGQSRLGLGYTDEQTKTANANEDARIAGVARNNPTSQSGMLPRDMSPGSQGAWEQEQARKGPDLKSMSMSDLVSYKLGQKQRLNESSANMHDASARNSDVQGMVSQAKLPGDLKHTASQTRQANASADESQAMLPGRIRNQDISGMHTLASTGNVQADTALKAFQNSPQYQKLTLAEKQAHIDQLGRQNGVSDLTMERLKLDLANYTTKEEIAAAANATKLQTSRDRIAGSSNIPLDEIEARVEAANFDPSKEERVQITPAQPKQKTGGVPFVHWGGKTTPATPAVYGKRPRAGGVPQGSVTATGPNGEKIVYNTKTKTWEK